MFHAIIITKMLENSVFINILSCSADTNYTALISRTRVEEMQEYTDRIFDRIRLADEKKNIMIRDYAG